MQRKYRPKPYDRMIEWFEELANEYQREGVVNSSRIFGKPDSSILLCLVESPKDAIYVKGLLEKSSGRDMQFEAGMIDSNETEAILKSHTGGMPLGSTKNIRYISAETLEQLMLSLEDFFPTLIPTSKIYF